MKFVIEFIYRSKSDPNKSSLMDIAVVSRQTSLQAEEDADELLSTVLYHHTKRFFGRAPSVTEDAGHAAVISLFEWEDSRLDHTDNLLLVSLDRENEVDKSTAARLYGP